jgi:hypothetical protein
MHMTREKFVTLEIINILNLALTGKLLSSNNSRKYNEHKIILFVVLQLVIRIFCKLALLYTDTVDATWNISA